MKPLQPLLWLDFETTGLDPQKHQPLEIALVATDENLVVESELSLVIGWDAESLHWSAIAKEMHEKNGLLEAVSQTHRDDPATWYHPRVQEAMVRWVEENGFIWRHMAGSSVQFDRMFGAVWFPNLMKMFHYRNFDVRTLRTWYGEDKPENTHRALEDIYLDLETVKKFRSA